jgi:hypothetical protein
MLDMFKTRIKKRGSLRSNTLVQKTQSFNFKDKKILIPFIIVVAIIGVVIIWRSFAGTFTGSEPENWTISSSQTVAVRDDANSSGGKYIEFLVPVAVQDYILIKKSELMAKPTSGPGWDFLKSQADAVWDKPDLSVLNSDTQTKVLAAALVYARTGDIAYRDKVISAIKQVPGTQNESGVVLPFARNIFGYVVAADLVGMPLNTLCNNGQTWETFLREARTKKFAGNTRWPDLEITSGEAASNWNSYALSSHLAISLALNDKNAVQRDTNIYKRFLGDTTSPWPAFNPTAGYNYNNNGSTWDMTPTMQRGINPDSSTDKRSGAIISDALRNASFTSVACCSMDKTARGYVEETLDALLAVNFVLKAQGSDFTGFQSNALKRAFDFLIKNGGQSGYSPARYLPLAINKMYGTNYNTSAGDSVSRDLGFGGWLF